MVYKPKRSKYQKARPNRSYPYFDEHLRSASGEYLTGNAAAAADDGDQMDPLDEPEEWEDADNFDWKSRKDTSYYNWAEHVRNRPREDTDHPEYGDPHFKFWKSAYDKHYGFHDIEQKRADRAERLAKAAKLSEMARDRHRRSNPSYREAGGIGETERLRSIRQRTDDTIRIAEEVAEEQALSDLLEQVEKTTSVQIQVTNAIPAAVALSRKIQDIQENNGQTVNPEVIAKKQRIADTNKRKALMQQRRAASRVEHAENPEMMQVLDFLADAVDDDELIATFGDDQATRDYLSGQFKKQQLQKQSELQRQQILWEQNNLANTRAELAEKARRQAEAVQQAEREARVVAAMPQEWNDVLLDDSDFLGPGGFRGFGI